ncbi:penicillin-binding protein 2 [Erythrobacter arachoides]|uniref:Penicillin-binding protein 2 n=1 Tax=Aurantiacibacter arachoides TaxID=1850444 RepID=A0A845A264_9SPHN|nr:penicillin-binding protein 2 [Aurantiacibacter arachoides]MXO93236.1 penicillin-binding protein 2 [Aurantiacibacter arachoides]GGD50895.1 peptidoglycan glycosyltransferase [Aurantiacibacter arachoides]
MDRHITTNQLKDVFDRRSFVIGAVQGGIGLLLAARMGYIAVAENEKYTLEAESNRVNLSLIPPRRGWILDRNGSPLASNRADFRVDVIPERVHDAGRTVDLLSELLDFTPVEKADLLQRVEDGRGFSAVAVASGLAFDKFAAVSVRLPELPGVIPQRGFSRFYPTGPSVGHLLGYVGAPSREEYEQDPEPLLLTPGFKMGKDGMEQQFETTLRGVPGARRVEVTAGGRIVRDLDTREDVQGNPIRLTIDGPLQDYAARRLGLESGSVVVIDCLTGDLLAMASMPSFDPNSFSDGIGRVEYSMLAENDRVPLRNKILQGLYPPGSTVKPMISMAFLEQGLSPDASVGCSGGLRVGNRVFRCWKRGGHGTVDMAAGIYQSCDVYFYHFAQQIGMDPIAAMARKCGMGQQFPLPVVSQFYGTVPDAEWKQEKYGEAWQPYDTVNATIGQGYMLANPLQLAVMSARLATGNQIMPRLVLDNTKPQFASMGFDPTYVDIIQAAMSDVVNGPGTAGRAKLPIENVLLAGKTGTAQVVGLNLSDGKSGPWKYRDHGLFVCFAPFDNPRYACAVVIEHGGGSGAAYPVARDVMTFLFDPQKALDALHGFEAQWGGTAQERLNRDYAAYAAAAGVDLPPAPAPYTLARQVDAEARAAATEPARADTGAIIPREDATPSAETPPTLGTGIASGAGNARTAADSAT